MDSEKWSLGVPVSARGGVGTVSPFLLSRFSEGTGEIALWSGLGMGHLGSDTVGGGRCSVVVVVAPSKQGGGLALSRLLCSAYPFLSVKACLCFCWLGGWTPLFLGLLHPDRGGVLSSVELLWVVLCCGIPGLRCTFPRC